MVSPYRILIGLMIVIIGGGTVFFRVVEGWSWIDAYFFTVVTYHRHVADTHANTSVLSCGHLVRQRQHVVEVAQRQQINRLLSREQFVVTPPTSELHARERHHDPTEVLNGRILEQNANDASTDVRGA